MEWQGFLSILNSCYISSPLVLLSCYRVINFILLTYELEVFNGYSVSRAWNTELVIPFRKNVICAWQWIFNVYFCIYALGLFLCVVFLPNLYNQSTYRNAAYRICCSILFVFISFYSVLRI